MAAPKNKQNSHGLPDDVIGLLAAADKRNNLPPGTMYSIMKQEVGGQFDRFIGDPAAYHYAANDKGKRIAPHTGKNSTAFGPFGIVESTAADPGFGVSPLKDKTLGEQIRFASDYLTARSKKGGLKAGLAGYGEGQSYAEQVMSRVNTPMVPTHSMTPVQTAVSRTAPTAVVSPVMPTEPVVAQASPLPVEQAQTSQAPAAVMAQGPDAWQQFLEASRAQVQPVQVKDLSYGAGKQAALQIPDFSAAVGSNRQPDFRMLNAMKGWV